jgi:hypothetical protein
LASEYEPMTSYFPGSSTLSGRIRPLTAVFLLALSEAIAEPGINERVRVTHSCKPGGLQRLDWLAGHMFELRNVVANYPFEKSRGFRARPP